MSKSESAGLLNWIELSTAALRQNIRALAKLVNGRPIAASVKSNAYGHGLAQIVSMLAPQNEVSHLSVHSLDEARQCRFAGWKRGILLLGPVAPQEIDAVIEYDLEPTIFDTRSLELLGKLSAKQKRPVRTHLKLETGTNRQGLTAKEIPAFVRLYRKYPSLGGLYGVSTHFANIEDTTNHAYAESQLAKFHELVALLKKHGCTPKVRHTASSAAAILFEKTRFDMVRPGISVYGHWPSKETYLSHKLLGGKNNLFMPVLSWKTRITQLKDVAAGEFVSYGCTYRTTTRAKIAVLPIGYYDGYSRALSNRGHVLIHGHRAPVRGRVCMNLMMVDVTHIPRVKLHDEVVVIGTQKNETISAEMLGDWSGTINYEILGRLNSATPKVIVT